MIKLLDFSGKLDYFIYMEQLKRIDIIRQAHAKALAEQLRLGGDLHTIELFPATQEDVLDEAERLDALDHEKKVDFDNDENEVDMENISPTMRGVFA